MFLTRLCKAFGDAKLPYAVVGGYAVALHGVPRGTADIDFVIKWTYKNLKKAEGILLGMGFVSRLPINSEDVFNFRDEYINNRNLIAWNFYNPVNPLEQVGLVITFDLSGASTKTIKVERCPVRILSKHDLIAMKKESGRPQDLADVAMLEDL